MPITVFYTPRMVADSQGYSPSARKPEQVVQSWQTATSTTRWAVT